MADAHTPIPGRLTQRFLEAALAGDRMTASAVVAEATRREFSLTRMYQDIFTPTLDRVGQLWALGKLTTAQEHLATQITLDQMARAHQSARPARALGLT